ncbi:phosphoglycolate phosphatase [Rhodoligotrophos appendicifer]|uniref:phosphoglycolate phosphatase n=1 Tax=Rhodoligotrophos appendicifer TaxID=987056 RepID=UPI0011869FAE|nr:phosphoglycolate phosphatase [Rhodoligotrophos appendicifer]
MSDLSKVSVIFDLDGTVVDTAPDLVAAMNEVLARHDRASIPTSQIRNLVGHGARVMMARGFAETGTPADDALLDRLYDQFLDHYLDHIADASAPFPGAIAAIQTLAARGARLGICTNKPEAAARKLLEALDLSRYFEAVIGGDSLKMKKPDPECFRESVRRLGGGEGPSVMVGDSETDVLTARAAGAPVIGVTFGYTPEPIETFHPDIVIDHFDKLGSALDQLLSRHPLLATD